MACDICTKEIESTQLRHSDGNGNYHMVCEFNQVREALGLPPIESIRRVKYYSMLDDAPVMSRTNITRRPKNGHKAI